jgi:hypothetical protein
MAIDKLLARPLQKSGAQKVATETPAKTVGGAKAWATA